MPKSSLNHVPPPAQHSMPAGLERQIRELTRSMSDEQYGAIMEYLDKPDSQPPPPLLSTMTVNATLDQMLTLMPDVPPETVTKLCNGKALLPPPSRKALWKFLRLSAKPECAYRIVFEDLWTMFSEHGGLQAPKYPWGSIKNGTFAEDVQSHIDWNSGKASPFISLFTHEEHARQWARTIFAKPHRRHHISYRSSASH